MCGMAVPLAVCAGDGEALFKANCMACHQVENREQPVVGPSLVEVNHLYGKKPKAFLQWCKEPGQKRKGAIQMPSMAHLKDAELLAVMEYIKTVTKGKKFKPEKGKKGDPYKVTGDAAKQPRVQRIFMKDASPASIAVTLDGVESLCWDATSCRMRYAWSGGFIDGFDYWKGNGKGLASVKGEVYYRAAGGQVSGLELDGVDVAPRFKGYVIEKGLPTFVYELGDVRVKESVVNAGGKLAIRIRVEGAGGGARYALGGLEKTDFSYSSGKMEDGALVLTRDECRDFTLTFSKK